MSAIRTPCPSSVTGSKLDRVRVRIPLQSDTERLRHRRGSLRLGGGGRAGGEEGQDDEAGQRGTGHGAIV